VSTLKNLLFAGLMLATTLARAQFAMVPVPLLPEVPRPSEAEIEREYRIDAARHVYNAYPMRIYHGKMPPLMYAVMLTDTEIDPSGTVVKVTVTREPAAAKEVSPWVVSLIRRAGPFPPPVRFNKNVIYKEIWLVDRSGQFQVDTLTEGQQ
jgi:hypothetical protein